MKHAVLRAVSPDVRNSRGRASHEQGAARGACGLGGLPHSIRGLQQQAIQRDRTGCSGGAERAAAPDRSLSPAGRAEGKAGHSIRTCNARIPAPSPIIRGKKGGAFSRRRVPSQNRVDGVARGVWLCSDMGADLRCRRAVRVPHGRKASCIHGRPACAFARLRLPKPPLTRQRARAASMTGRMLSTQRSPARMASSAL